MADPVGAAADAVKAPFSWAKAKPIGFILLVLVVFILTVRFAGGIVAWLNNRKWGRFFTGAKAAAALVLAFLGSLATQSMCAPRPVVIESPPAVVAMLHASPEAPPRPLPALHVFFEPGGAVVPAGLNRIATGRAPVRGI